MLFKRMSGILQTPLKDLRLKDLYVPLKRGSLGGVSVSLLLNQLKTELKNKGLLCFFPGFWLSTEWYVPDGFNGIAIPFWATNPQALKLLKKQLPGVLEGTTARQFMKLLRHECGHAFENAYQTRRLRSRQRLFGCSGKTPYLDRYQAKPYSRNYVQYLGDGYAQSHPDEDFAETFAVWLDPEIDWRSRYQGKGVPSRSGIAFPGAYQKLEYIDQLAKRFGNEKVKRLPVGASLAKTYGLGDVRDDSRTLGEFIDSELALNQTILDQSLTEIFRTSEQSRVCLKTQILNFTKHSSFRYPAYLGEKMSRDLAIRCLQLNLEPKKSPILKPEQLAWLSQQYFEAGGEFFRR